MTEQKTTRRATPAERLAARALGVKEPETVEVDTTPAGVKHLERIRSRPEPVRKPKGMSTAEWYQQRFKSRSGRRDDEEEREEPGPLIA